jgi:hypothetical protein
MSAIPLRSEYGPTLGALLAPRWRSTSPLARTVIRLAVLLLVLGALALALTLENAHYSHGGRLPFGFSYRGLYRVPPRPGAFVDLRSPHSGGPLRYEFAVGPLRLPAYSGELSGELPIYANAYIRALPQRFAGFVLEGEGRTKVGKLPAYEVLYTTRVDGTEMYGRNVLLVPERTGERDGVEIVMLTSTTASSQIKGPNEVGSKGILLRPLKTFSFG